jgi:hypothetical protein
MAENRETPVQGSVTSAIRQVLLLAGTTPIATSLDECDADRVPGGLVLSYASSFDALWRFGDRLWKWLRAGRLFVLVWDHTPLDAAGVSSLRTRDYVTAFDWVVALSLRMPRHEPDLADQPHVVPRVVIVDLASRHQLGAPAVRMLPRLQHPGVSAIPWLRIVGAERIATVLGELLSTPAAVPPTGAERTLLAPLWRHALSDPSEPDDRHAIANLVGPRLLLRSLAAASPRKIAGHAAALEALMDSLDLVPANRPSAPSRPVARSEWTLKFDRVVLIDDMAEAGWADFLRGFLDLDEGELAICTRPSRERLFGAQEDQTLMDFLAGALARGEPYPLFVGTHRPLIFLDLRLFAHAGTRTDECEFLSNLLALADAHHALSRPLSGPAIPDNEVRRLRGWIASGAPPDDTRAHVALTVLPRLLAIAMPMVPIIIFSSATSRRVADTLRPYGNLLLHFAKPTFFGAAPGPVVAEAVATLRHALSRAADVGRGRAAVRAALAERNIAKPEPLPAVIEIYVDESGHAGPGGKATLTVGGLVIAYPDHATPAALSDSLRASGLQWGQDCDDPGAALPVNPVRKAYQSGYPTPSREIQKGLSRIDAVSRTLGARVGAFALSADAVWDAGLLSWSSPDTMYRLLLSQALELLLFDWMSWKGFAEIPVHIYVATRLLAGSTRELIATQRHYGLNLRKSREARPDGDAFEIDDPSFRHLWNGDTPDVGFVHEAGRPVKVTWRSPSSLGPDAPNRHRLFASGLLAFSFSSDHVHPIVNELFRRRHTSRQVARALGVTLEYFPVVRDRPAHQLPRQIHYAADWVVSKRECVPPAWWENGFHDRSDDALLHVLECSRALDRERGLVEALRQWHVLAAPAPPRSTRRYVGSRLSQRLADMTSAEFQQLCDVIDPR